MGNPMSDDEFKRRFDELAAEWKAATIVESSAVRMAEHSAYQQIIGMGERVVPLIINQLEKELNHWFFALRTLTGVNPVKPEDAGNMNKMREAWVLYWNKDINNER